MSEERRCSHKVHDPFAWRGRSCARRATTEEGGLWYCAQHTPAAVAAKQIVRQKQWAEEARILRVQSKIEEAKRAIVSAAIAASEQRGSWDAVAESVATMREIEKGLTK